MASTVPYSVVCNGDDMDETQKAIIDWLATGEVGMSSKQMAMWLAFEKRTGDWGAYPHDPDDMTRCLKLLRKAPGLREHLPRMAFVSPEWAAIVYRWDEIEAMLLEEFGIDWSRGKTAPLTYAMMRSAIDGVRKHGR